MGRIYRIEYDIPAAPNDGFLYACCHPTCRTHFVLCPPPGFATVRLSLSLFLRLQFLLRTVMKKTMVMAIITTSSSTSSFFACLAQKIPFLVLLKKMPPPNNVYT